MTSHLTKLDRSSQCPQPKEKMTDENASAGCPIQCLELCVLVWMTVHKEGLLKYHTRIQPHRMPLDLTRSKQTNRIDHTDPRGPEKLRRERNEVSEFFKNEQSTCHC
jgi:hypothetical protein